MKNQIQNEPSPSFPKQKQNPACIESKITAAQPEQIAPAYVFLASEPDSSYITGIILPKTGGLSVQ